MDIPDGIRCDLCGAELHAHPDYESILIRRTDESWLWLSGPDRQQFHACLECRLNRSAELQAEVVRRGIRQWFRDPILPENNQ